MTDTCTKIVELCEAEYKTFRQGRSKEYDHDVYRRVGAYWDSLAKDPKYKVWKGYNGRSDIKFTLGANDEVIIEHRDDNDNQPWSAAFISWVMRESGAGKAFAYSSSHSTYIVNALKAAKTEDAAARLIARRRDTYAPKPGDLIACERRKDTDATFDTYPAHVAAGKFEAHCDFVVKVDSGAGTLFTIGGNVSNSVSKKTWRIDDHGRIGGRDPNSSTAKVVCVIENRL